MSTEKSLIDVLEELEATDEDLIEVLVLRNSDTDEALVKRAADERVQSAGSLGTALERATAEMEQAVELHLKSVESFASEKALLFDVQEELASRAEPDAGQAADGDD